MSFVMYEKNFLWRRITYIRYISFFFAHVSKWYIYHHSITSMKKVRNFLNSAYFTISLFGRTFCFQKVQIPLFYVKRKNDGHGVHTYICFVIWQKKFLWKSPTNLLMSHHHYIESGFDLSLVASEAAEPEEEACWSYVERLLPEELDTFLPFGLQSAVFVRCILRILKCILSE